MTRNVEKIKKLMNEYQAVLVILESVLLHIAQYPYIITDSDSGTNILNWQLEMKKKLSELNDQLNKEYEKK